MIELDQLAGSQVNDRFQLQQRIGRGASGVVYRAEDSNGRTIALKLVPPSTDTGQGSARYLRGTRLASQLNHPHIVQVLESGRWGPQQRYFYLAMELVEGVSLSLLRYANLAPERAVGLISQVLEAAVYVHARGTLHRDLKPDNVMVSRGNGRHLHCQVTDFGIASNRIEDATFTLQGAVIGTPAYMAPEQAQGLPSMGPGIDIYAIGVMLYELLCGQLPFGGTIQGLLYQKIHEAPPSLPREVVLPAGLSDVVMKMIARRPEARFSHARDVLTALRPFSLPPVLEDQTWIELFGSGNEPTTASNTSSPPTLADLPPDSSTSRTERPGSERSTWISSAPATRLWGREELLNYLDLQSRQVESGAPQVLLLSGGLGVGKSALMNELAIRLQEEGRFQVLRTAFSAASSLGGGLRGAVEMSLGVRGRSADTLRRVVQEHLRQSGEEDPTELDSLIEWLRPPLEATASTPTAATPDFAPGLRFLRRRARSRPVLLLIDDLHQGGLAAAALINFLLFEVEFEPCDLLVVGALVSEEIHPEFTDGLDRSNHSEGRSRHIVQVPRLPFQTVARGLRQELRLSTAVAENIAERSGGNPMIARGLAQAMETEALFTTSQSPTSSGTQVIEGTLATMLQRILQSLFSTLEDPSSVQAMLRALAILGTATDVQTLAEFLDTSVVDLAFETSLDLLIEHGVVVELRSSSQDNVELRPLILAQVIVSDLGRRQRRRMHQRAIEILREIEDTDPGVLGDHHQEVGELDTAIRYWKRAETRALIAGAPFAAVEWGFKLIAQLAEPERSIWAVRMGRILLDAGDPRRAEHVLRGAAASKEPDLALLASDVLCDVYENLGEGAAWTELAQRIENLLPQATRSGRHAALCALAMWRTSHGDDIKGRQAAQEALSISSSPVEIRRSAQRLAFSCLPSLSLDQAAEAAEQALEASGSHPQLRARSLRTLGVVRMWQGEGNEAVRLHEETLALARWKGLSSRAALALQDLGDSLRVSGRSEAARERYQSSILAAEALDLASTVFLVRFKLLMCDIALEEETDLSSQLSALTGPATDAGLALAEPFGSLLLAWSSARNNHLESARTALEKAKVLEGFRVDPQVEEIFREIREKIN